jgi:hypothetical protein
LKPGFGQINVALNSAQGLVTNRLFVAQSDDGIAFCLQRLAGKFLEVRRE